MRACIPRTLRFALALLMLGVGALGPVGHARLQSGGETAGAWFAAIEAERDWLANGDTHSANTTVQVFGVAHRHSHGDAPAHEHGGPDSVAADHVHGMAFLLPAMVGMRLPCLNDMAPCSLATRLTSAQPDDPDRPPRSGAAPA